MKQNAHKSKVYKKEERIAFYSPMLNQMRFRKSARERCVELEGKKRSGADGSVPGFRRRGQPGKVHRMSMVIEADAEIKGSIRPGDLSAKHVLEIRRCKSR